MNDYQGIELSKAEVEHDQWKKILTQKLPERSPYEKGTILHISQVSVRVLGTTYDETDYFIYLHELYENPKVHILSEELDKTIKQETFQAIQKILMINQQEKGLSVNRFVAFLDGEQLLPKLENPIMNRHLRKAFMTVLKRFQDHHSKDLNHPDFRRVLVDSIKWTINHLEPWLKEVNIEEEMPHVVWYGDASKSQLYFLYYLMLIGCDVIIFHPEGKDLFAEVDPNQEVSLVETYPSTTNLQAFPKEKPERQSTVAYQASREMDSVLHHEGSSLYKPWQFRNHMPESVTLKTTYDELFLLAKERAFIRPNFKATHQTVEIPNLFAKVMGVSENRREYWDRIQKLAEFKESETIRNFPFKEEISANYKYHYQDALNQQKDCIDPEKLIGLNIWQYKFLPMGTQKAIAYAISNICRHPKLLPRHDETLEDVRHYMFAQATSIPKRLLTLMQTFDFSQTIPKLILYNNEKNGELSRADAVVLLLMNAFGIDIIIYNPPGHNCIEQYIDEKVFDTHWLEDMVFDLDFKEPSVVKKFLQSIKFSQ